MGLPLPRLPALASDEAQVVRPLDAGERQLLDALRLDELARDQLSLDIQDARPRSRLAEPCPRCGATRGELCRTENGDVAVGEHKERRRAAGFKALKP